MSEKDLRDRQYGLLFDVRRSMRYHDRRRSFFERLHQVTGLLTVLLAGSVLFDIARPGNSPTWLLAIAVVAALLSALDLVVGYAARAALHRQLKMRFSQLEITLGEWDGADTTLASSERDRLRIEQDEPPVYRALDLLCYNETLRALGRQREEPGVKYARLTRFQRWTCQILHWSDLAAG